MIPYNVFIISFFSFSFILLNVCVSTQLTFSRFHFHLHFDRICVMLCMPLCMPLNIELLVLHSSYFILYEISIFSPSSIFSVYFTQMQLSLPLNNKNVSKSIVSSKNVQQFKIASQRIWNIIIFSFESTLFGASLSSVSLSNLFFIIFRHHLLVVCALYR